MYSGSAFGCSGCYHLRFYIKVYLSSNREAFSFGELQHKVFTSFCHGCACLSESLSQLHFFSQVSRKGFSWSFAWYKESFFSTYSRFSEKVYQGVRSVIFFGKFCVRTKWMISKAIAVIRVIILYALFQINQIYFCFVSNLEDIRNLAGKSNSPIFWETRNFNNLLLKLLGF